MRLIKMSKIIFVGGRWLVAFKPYCLSDYHSFDCLTTGILPLKMGVQVRVGLLAKIEASKAYDLHRTRIEHMISSDTNEICWQRIIHWKYLLRISIKCTIHQHLLLLNLSANANHLQSIFLYLWRNEISHQAH